MSGSYNLIGTGGSGGLSASDHNLLNEADPGLETLGNNGGSTSTISLLAGSPAIKAGTPVNGVTTDQRSLALDSPPDIGALQTQTGTHTPTPTPTPTPAPTPPPTPVLIGAQPITFGRGKNKKITGAELFFSRALNFGSAQNIGNYRVTQRITKKKIKVVSVVAATFNPGNDSLTLLLGPSTKGKVLQLMVSGLSGKDGEPVSNSSVNL